jgi:23S rRNA (guanosine2251-2'-O)-methyltransferase
MTKNHAPKESGIMAKSASGALDIVPICSITNLRQGLEELKEKGFWSVVLTEHAQQSLCKVNLTGKIALVLGSEGHGVRRLTLEQSDFQAYLPTSKTFSTLNVSNAAATALYEISRQQRSFF